MFILTADVIEKYKLRCFDRKNFNLLKVIDTNECSLRLISNSVFALLDSKSILHLYDQRDLEKKKEIYLKNFDSYPYGMTHDRSQYITFFDWDHLKSFCVD